MYDKQTSSETNTNFTSRNDSYPETTTTVNDNCSETTTIARVETRAAQKQSEFHMWKQDLLRYNHNCICGEKELLRNNYSCRCGNKCCSVTTTIVHMMRPLLKSNQNCSHSQSQVLLSFVSKPNTLNQARKSVRKMLKNSSC